MQIFAISISGDPTDDQVVSGVLGALDFDQRLKFVKIDHQL